jgi:hypothetical protein
VLIRRATLDEIAAGRVDLQFRRQRRPTVRAGGRLRTAVGELAIDSVDVVDDPASITDADARRAGSPDADTLRRELDYRGADAGTVYRVALHLAGPDARIALRDVDALTDDDVAALRRRLSRSPWAHDVLALIAANPGVRAPDLAASRGEETAPFKARVRRLKELGLTESLPVGYRLSPRGRAYLSRREIG